MESEVQEDGEVPTLKALESRWSLLSGPQTASGSTAAIAESWMVVARLAKVARDVRGVRSASSECAMSDSVPPHAHYSAYYLVNIHRRHKSQATRRRTWP